MEGKIMEENKFGVRLRQLRIENGETCEELAKKMGIARSTLSHWETNRRSASIDQIIWLANYFGVTVDYMVGTSDKKDTSVLHATVNGHNLQIKYRPGDMDHDFSMDDAMKVIEKLESIGIDVKTLLK